MNNNGVFRCFRPFLLCVSSMGMLAVVMHALPAAAKPSAEGETSEGEFSGHGFNVVRIENEIKLSVPREQTEEVWSYLLQHYGESGNNSLQTFDKGFTVTFSDEFFVDRYFDNENLDLLNRECGIRHRTRSVDSDPTNRKHGRQLIQLKRRRDGDQALNRSEIKFPVEVNGPSRDPLDMHPLIGLVEKKHRAEFLKAVEDVGLNATEMRNTVTLEQRRRRVYISLNANSFATITLDEVASSRWWSDLAFTEVEMELNEIGYTEATLEQRAFMEEINEKMKQDLLTAFPRIVQDQTPKYNKVFNHFDAQYLAFPVALSIGSPLEPWLTAIPVALIAGAVYLVRGQKRARQRQVQAATPIPAA